MRLLQASISSRLTTSCTGSATTDVLADWLLVGHRARDGSHGEVVGRHVAPLSASHLHQAPLAVAPLVVRLKYAHRLSCRHRNFVVPSCRETISRKHLETHPAYEKNVYSSCHCKLQMPILFYLFFLNCFGFYLFIYLFELFFKPLLANY